MNEKDKLILKLIEEKGGSREDYLNLLDAIAYHESGGSMDSTIKQKGGGPGRGKYQFEQGPNAGGITAAKRTKQYYKSKNIPVPLWLDKAASGKDLDASRLTPEQQDILFLGNMRQHPKADLGKVVNKEQPIDEFWANYHWAGSPRDRNKRLRSFNESFTEYQKKSKPVPQDSIPAPYTTKEVFENEWDELSNLWKNPKQFWQDLKTTYKGEKTEFRKEQAKRLKYQRENQNQQAQGGAIPALTFKTKELNSFDEGGSHEANPLGGIPQGIGPNGKMNTVEEGETSFDLKNGKYIFSDRLTI